MEPDEINDDDKMTEIMKIDTGNMNFLELRLCWATDTQTKEKHNLSNFVSGGKCIQGNWQHVNKPIKILHYVIQHANYARKAVR